MTWQAYLFMTLWLVSVGIVFMQGASLGRIRDQRNAARNTLTHMEPAVEDGDGYHIFDPQDRGIPREAWEDERARQFESQHTIGHPDWRHPK